MAVAVLVVLGLVISGASDPAAAGKRRPRPHRKPAVVRLSVKLSGPGSATVGQSVTLGLSATLPRGDRLTSFVVLWGDGSTPLSGKKLPGRAAHVFKKSGSYNVTAIVVDKRKASARAARVIQVSANPGPAPSASPSPSTAPSPSATPSSAPAPALSLYAGRTRSITAGPATAMPVFAAGTAVDPAGNLYVTDTSNNVVAKVTPAGAISVVVGNGNSGTPVAGPATSSPLGSPTGLALDSTGNLYIADGSNNVVEKVTPAGGLSVVAGNGRYGRPVAGQATSSPLGSPTGLALDGAGNLYIADVSSYLVEKVTPAGALSVVAGNGTSGRPVAGQATSSPLGSPTGLAFDGAGNLYIADGRGHVVERVTPAGVLSVAAGNGSYGAPVSGTATSSPLGSPSGVAFDAAGNLFIADNGNSLVEKVTPGGALSVAVGNGNSGVPVPGPATGSPLGAPTGIAVSGSGSLYIPDGVNQVVEKVTAGTLTVFAGLPSSGAPVPGPATSSPLNNPAGLAVDGAGNVYIADASNNVIEKIAPTGSLSVFAGTGAAGPSVAGPATSSPLNGPSGVAVDGAGNVYVADTNNNVVETVTPSGVLSRTAGTGVAGTPVPGQATSSRLNGPGAVAADNAGNIFIADLNNDVVEKVTPAGRLSVVAGTGWRANPIPGDATTSPLSSLAAIALDPAGDVLIADGAFIDKVTPAGALSILVTLPNNGYANGLALDGAGNLFLSAQNQILKVAADGTTTVVAGSGTYGPPTPGAPLSSKLGYPAGLAIDNAGNLLVADPLNNDVERISGLTSSGPAPTATSAPVRSPGTISVLVGRNRAVTAGPATATPLGAAATVIDSAGNIYVADQANFVVERVSTAGALSVVAGQVGSPGFVTPGPATSSRFSAPSSLALDPAGNLYVGNSGQYPFVAKVTPAGALSVVAGTGGAGTPMPGPATSSTLSSPNGVALDSSGNLYIADGNNYVVEKVTPAGVLSVVAGNGSFGKPLAGPATSSPLGSPSGVAVDSSGNLDIADSPNSVVEKVTPTGALSVVAGNGLSGRPAAGPATSSSLGSPSGLAFDAASNLYIADTTNSMVEKVTAAGVLSVVAGNGNSGPPVSGSATSSPLGSPSGVAADGSGNLYIADSGNQVVERVATAGTLSVVAGVPSAGVPVPGPGTASPLNTPGGVAVDSAGSIYVADTNNNVVEKITSSGTLSVLAGTGAAGAPVPGAAASSPLNGPGGVAVDASGSVYIADTYNNVVEKVTPAGMLSLVAGTGRSGPPAPGTATSSPLQLPSGVAVDGVGNIFIADTGNNVVEKVTPTGTLSIVAGNGTQGRAIAGPATSSPLTAPVSVVVDGKGGVYIVRTDAFGSRGLDTVSAAGLLTENPNVSSLTGGIALDAAANVYLAQFGGSVIRLTPSGDWSTVAGGGPAQLPTPGAANLGAVLARGLAVDGGGNLVVAGDNVILRVTNP